MAARFSQLWRGREVWFFQSRSPAHSFLAPLSLPVHSYVKLGQILSIRPDVLPPDVMVELARLQDKIKPFSTVEARAIIEADLGAPVDEIFSEFTAEPIAAASLAQVRERESGREWRKRGGQAARRGGKALVKRPHPIPSLLSSLSSQVYRARVRATGQEVAVKVQRPAALSTISKVRGWVVGVSPLGDGEVEGEVAPATRKGALLAARSPVSLARVPCVAPLRVSARRPPPLLRTNPHPPLLRTPRQPAQDLYVLRRAVGVYERIVRRFTAQTTDYQILLSTFAEGLYTELDFRNEALNNVRMQELMSEATFVHSDGVVIPQPLIELTSRCVFCFLGVCLCLRRTAFPDFFLSARPQVQCGRVCDAAPWCSSNACLVLHSRPL